MHVHRLCSLFLVGLMAVSLSGCIYSHEIAQTRKAIEREYRDADFDYLFMFTMGPGSMRTMKWLAKYVDDDDVQIARSYLDDVKRIQVGVFDVDDLPDLEDMDVPALKRFQRGGWETAVKARDRDEMVWVMYRERHDAVRDLYVIVLDYDTMVLARVQGNLNRLLERAVRDYADLNEINYLGMR